MWRPVVLTGRLLREQRRAAVSAGLGQHGLGELEHEVGRSLARLVRDARIYLLGLEARVLRIRHVCPSDVLHRVELAVARWCRRECRHRAVTRRKGELMKWHELETMTVYSAYLSVSLALSLGTGDLSATANPVPEELEPNESLLLPLEPLSEPGPMGFDQPWRRTIVGELSLDVVSGALLSMLAIPAEDVHNIPHDALLWSVLTSSVQPELITFACDQIRSSKTSTFCMQVSYYGRNGCITSVFTLMGPVL